MSLGLSFSKLSQHLCNTPMISLSLDKIKYPDWRSFMFCSLIPLLQLLLCLTRLVHWAGVFINTDFFCLISGLINIPAVAFGIFSGGLIMKKFRIGVLGAAKLSLGSSFFGYLLLLSLFAMGCENSDVAGLTVSYHGYAGKALLQKKGYCKPNSFLVLFTKWILVKREWLTWICFPEIWFKSVETAPIPVGTVSWPSCDCGINQRGLCHKSRLFFWLIFNYYCHGTHPLSPVIPGNVRSSVGGMRFN